MHRSLSYIDSQAKLAKNVVVEPFVTIEKNVEIGSGTWIGSNVTIMEGARIGKNCEIFPGAVISAIPQDLKFEGEESLAIIGDNTVVRECATINRATKATGKTVVGDNCLIMAYAHIAHDCSVGNNNVFANNAAIAGHVDIGNFVVIGGFCGVHQFCSLGDYCFTGMNTSITMDIPAFVKVASNPARIIGLNSVGMSRNNISSESIDLIKKAFKILYKKGLKLEESLNEIDILKSETNDTYLEIFLKSIKDSSRGILR